MKYTTAIFDLDGTLLDTLDDLMDAVNYALTTLQHPARTKKEICRFVGNGIGKLMERSLPGGTSNPRYEDALALFRQYYSCHCEDKTHVYPGVLELLEQLHTAGCKTAIVSNKLDSAVVHLNQTYFHAIVPVAIGEQPGLKRKPAPDMVEHALTLLGSSKEESVYIGDSDVDIQTAAHAGLPCISVTWGFRDADFLKEHHATVLADTPKQVYRLIMEGLL